jgi:NAD(P)-dependent dehydrogenase (short-subunit alcohol dehydrogenase family)
MEDARSLDGRVIAIAGVGGGLGPAVAKRLGEAGAIVAGADRGQEGADAVGAELGLGSRCTRSRWPTGTCCTSS